jgi:2-dehydro-3-deoxyphosphogluconate aldolase / (4S)-4-hydroxy-2-oxoglutarate aldolase
VRSSAPTVLDRLAEVRVLPVATVESASEARSLGRALLAAGLPCVEITLRTEAAMDALRAACAVDGLLVGAGTVLSPEQAAAAAEAGARFAVAPGLSDEVVASCAELGLPFVPGVATPSEIDRSRALGVSVVKVFPARELGGVGFLRAVSAPYRDTRFLPTGGIGPGDLREYLALPSVLAVGGSWLVKPDLVRQRRFDEIERLAREAVELARGVDARA